MKRQSNAFEESNLDILHRRLLEWDISQSILGPKGGLAMDEIDSKRVSIPDRFLVPAEYVGSFIYPAFLEIKASILSSISTDTVSCHEMSITSLPVENRMHDVELHEISLRFKQPTPDGKVSSRELPSVSPDTVCVVTLTPSLASRPSMLGLVRPSRTPGGLLLRVIRSRLDDTGINGRSVFLHPVSSLISASREFEALCSIKSISLRDEILYGIETAEEGPVHELPSLLPAPLSKYLDGRLNPAQRAVIDCVCGLRGKYKPRIVLVRGPPGSGKTVTLNSVLNAMHVQQFNAYYDSIVSAVKAGRMTNSERSWLDLASVSKPRIIVCAPSNVAIDNIILRIISDQFTGGDGTKYLPWLVRIGKGSMQHQEVAKKALSRMVDEITSISGPELVSKISKLESLYAELRQGVLLELARLQCLLMGTPHSFKKSIETRVMVGPSGHLFPYWVDHETESSLTELPAPASEGPPVDQMQEWILYSKDLMRQLELWEAVHWELQRFRLVQSFIQESLGAANSGAIMAAKYQLQAHLETLLMNQASIVCGTLNSTALAQVKNSIEFQACVVDEAAQAVELSTLIPLQLGVKQLVLVGDPQQLPATVLAKREIMGNYERSLFERMGNCGVPVHTLDVQYRMHPAISHFPRNQFYQGILKDSESVSRSSPFFSRPPFNLNPFMFLDVVSGRDSISSQSQSRFNPEEAAVCVSIFFALLRIAQEQGMDLKGSVGIISPYAEQVRVLKQSFEAAGIRVSGHLDDIEIATVDSFQGKEKDIIILSTVRGALEANGVGFLADMRRMNVALTRAKIGLFVVGKSQTLEVNDHWAGLIRQAKQTPRAYVQVRGPGEDVYGVFCNTFLDSSSNRR